ncbi:hypothetical protein [Nocardia wallacei]|uniref:hypothetical protein n=1 Tax=Nocardia wallacei TaxID=480035 RepID=UPI002453E780|nr:hypothetical protein [Nocardia wallacei]
MTDMDMRSPMDCQLDPAWLEWSTDKDERLREFFTHDVPAMVADKYSTAGLRVAEHALLQRFPPGPSAPPEEEAVVRFACYLGQVFVESLNAYWFNDPFPYTAPRATIRFEFTDVRIDVHDQVVLALHHRTGTRWHDLHTALASRCRAWWESGRSAR